MTREIIITPVLNGFICKVGCQQVVFESVPSLILNLEKYLGAPDVTEARFIRDAVNKMPNQPDAQCSPTPAGWTTQDGTGSADGANTATPTTVNRTEARPETSRVNTVRGGPQPLGNALSGNTEESQTDCRPSQEPRRVITR